MNKVVLSSIIDIISGGTPKTSVNEYWKDGNIGWLSVTDFNDDYRFVYQTEKKITEKGLKESNTKLLNYGDIIISARGTVGALAQIGIPMCFNQSCFGIRGKTDKVDNDFLFYALRNYVQHIKRRSQGSVFDTINLKSFDLMEIEIPTTISTQQKIAKVLSDLDAKIELNNKINTELEAMAKTLYDYWFVQFDFPDVDGKPYKTSGGKMVYNAELKREIPVGWKNGQLGDVGKVSMCKRVMKHETSSNEEIPFFKISTFGGDANTYISRDLFKLYREKYSYPKRGDILISAAGTIGKIVIFDGESSYFQDSNIVWIDNDGSKIPNCFLFYYYQTEPWVATGGSTIKRLYNDNIRSLKTIFPNSEILKQFSNIINPRLEKKQQIESENKKLSSLRDWLLPMLMNGQVRVGDVEVELGLVAEGNVEYKKH
jgi:type I restriction enzyme S subunit